MDMAVVFEWFGQIRAAEQAHEPRQRECGLPGQQRPSERLRATPRRLADKPAPSLHSARQQKKPRQRDGASGQT